MAKVTIILKAKNLVSGVAKKVRGDVSKIATGVRGSLGKLNKSLGNIRLGLGGVTAGLIGAGGLTFAFKKALGAAIGFEKGLAEIKTLGVEKSLDAIGAEVDELSRSFGQKPQAVIRAYYDAISAGVKEANVAQFLREASTLALAGATDISTATDLLTTLRSVYGDLTDKELASFVNATKNLGKTTIPELAASLGQIAPTAAAIGLSMEELSAAMAVTTVSLSDTGLATTGLRSFLSQILKPSEETRKLAKELGIEFSIAALKTKGLSGFLEELIPKLEGNDEAIVTLFGDVRAFGVAAVLAKDGGAAFEEALVDIREEVETGALERAAAQMKDTAAVRLDILRAELDSVVRTLTLQLLPGISDFAKGIVDIIKLKTGAVFRNEFAEPIKKTGAALRVLQEQLENTQPFIKVGKAVVSNTNEIERLESAIAEAEAEFIKAATVAFPGFESRVTELASTLIRDGTPPIDAFRDAVQRVGSQLTREAMAADVAAEAKKKETEARLAATAAIEKEEEARKKAAAAAKKRRKEEEEEEEKKPKLGPEEAGVTALKEARAQVTATTREVANLEAAFRQATDPAVLSVLGEQLVRSLQEVDPELGAEAITEKFREMFPMVDFETLAQDAPFFAELLKKANPESVGEAIGSALSVAKGSIEGFTGGITQLRDALSVLGVEGAGPFGKFAKGMAKVQAVISTAQAVFELAQAIAALASFRFAEAVKHGLAAAKFKMSASAGKKAAAQIPGAQAGGLVPNVPGVPTNRDGVPILAQTGELVMPQAMTKQLRALLSSIPRSGGGFQVGGVIGAPGAAGPGLPQLNMTLVFERSFANAREMAREFMDVVSNEARRFGYAVNVTTAEELQDEVPGGGV